MSATLISRKSIYDTQGISRMRRYNLLLLIKAVENNEENYFQTHLIDIKLSRRLTCLYISCSLLIIILKIEIVCITY